MASSASAYIASPIIKHFNEKFPPTTVCGVRQLWARPHTGGPHLEQQAVCAVWKCGQQENPDHSARWVGLKSVSKAIVGNL